MRKTKRVIRTTDAPKAIGPYSQAVVANGFLFLSGQIPLDPATGTIVNGDIREQARRIMENAKAVLAAGGCSMEQVVKTTIYLTNMAEFASVNEVYGSYFSTEPPARSTVGVAHLPKDAEIEMDFVAAVP